MTDHIPTTSKPRIIIIGGGFGGLELTKALKSLDVQIVLIDKNNYHTFQPLLYQVATAALEPDSIAYPLRKILRKQHNVIFRMAEVLQILPDKNSVRTSIGDISYDHLVLAVGTTTNFFGLKDIEQNALQMKTLVEALRLRSLILENFEKALLTDDVREKDALMTFVIAGGGPTGVELAGALGELKKVVLPNDYPELDFKKMQIHVVDMNSRLLRMMSEDASKNAKEFLSKLGVDIWLDTKVSSFDGERVQFSNGKCLNTKNLIWGAGVTGAVIPGLKPELYLPNKRIKVDPFNRVESCDNIFAIGDISAMITDKTPKGHPQLAPVAIQQAKCLAENFKRTLRHKSLKPFCYKDLGAMATVGRNDAVVDLPFVKFQGPLGWLVWLLVHLMTLVGFRSRLVALINWAWSYFSYDRGLRLIIRPLEKNDQ